MPRTVILATLVLLPACIGGASDRMPGDDAPDSEVDTDRSPLTGCAVQIGCYTTAAVGTAPPPVEYHMIRNDGPGSDTFMRWALVDATGLAAYPDLDWSEPVEDAGSSAAHDTILTLPTRSAAGDWFLVVQGAEKAGPGWPWSTCSIGRRVESAWVDEAWVEPDCPGDLVWPAEADPNYHAWIHVE